MEQVSKYFNAEKSESLIFIIVGILAIAVAVYFLVVLKKPFYNGLAYSIAAVAIIQLVVGSSVYLRSPKDILRVDQLIQTEKAKIQTEEIPRMKIVMKNFAIYKMIEIGLIILGIALFLILKNNLMRGIGLGLIIQASLMLVFDLFAENRGREYLFYLESFASN